MKRSVHAVRGHAHAEREWRRLWKVYFDGRSFRRLIARLTRISMSINTAVALSSPLWRTSQLRTKKMPSRGRVCLHDIFTPIYAGFSYIYVCVCIYVGAHDGVVLLAGNLFCPVEKRRGIYIYTIDHTPPPILK